MLHAAQPNDPFHQRTRTSIDTVAVTLAYLDALDQPPFQRELQPKSKKMQEVADAILADGGVVPGVITLGVIDTAPRPFVVDGQHRLHALRQLLEELGGVGYADVRIMHFASMDKAAAEYRRLNSAIVQMKSVDHLRAREESADGAALRVIRHACPFVGYSNIGRNPNGGPLLSMAVLLRAWMGGRQDAPTLSVSAETAARLCDSAETDALIGFALLCKEAWGRDREHAKLWGSLNLMVCGWLFRRIVLAGPDPLRRSTRFNPADFRKGLAALASETSYLEFLVGRTVSDRDRSPAYGRVKAIFQRRYLLETGRKAQLPSPEWAAAR